MVRDLSTEQARWVDRIVRQVSSEGQWKALAEAPRTAEVIDGVQAEAVGHADTAELGPVLLGWEIWKRLGMPELLNGLAFNRSQCQAAAISVINRLADSLHDGKSLLRMIGELNAVAGAGKEKPLIVMDAGVATRQNLDLLRAHDFGYLVNDTRGQRKRYIEIFCKQDGFQVVAGRADKEPVYVRVMDDPLAAGGDRPGERIVLCKSQPRGKKEQAIVSNAERRLLEDLRKLALRVERKRLRARSKIERAIGRIQSRHSRASRFYAVMLEDGSQGLRLTWERNEAMFREAADLFGCYVLRTDERTLNEHQLWQLYISLTQAEAGFKALKSDLGLRPNPHQKEDRVDAHVFICVLAYHLRGMPESHLSEFGHSMGPPAVQSLRYRGKASFERYSRPTNDFVVP